MNIFCSGPTSVVESICYIQRHHWFRQKLSHKLVAYVYIADVYLKSVKEKKNSQRLWFTAKANIAKLLPKNCLENAGISHTATHASICAEDKNVRSILKVPLILFSLTFKWGVDSKQILGSLSLWQSQLESYQVVNVYQSLHK